MPRHSTPPVCEGFADCNQCDVRDLVLFSGLKEPEFEFINHPVQKYVFPSGGIVFHAGETGRNLYTVRSGLLKLVHFGVDGSQRIVQLLRPGAVAGIEALVGEPFEQTAIAVESSDLCQIAIEDVNRLDRESHAFHRNLLERWHMTVRDATHWIIYMSTGEAKARVARLFLYLAGLEDECTLFSRDDVGAVLGLTPETVCRVIANLKEARVITELKRNRYRCDRPSLLALAGVEDGVVPG